MTREQFILHVSATRESFRRFLVALCCGDTALADDVAQESYMKAYLSCDGISNPDKFRSWLYKIGYNTFLNHKRGVKRKVDYTEVEDMAAADASDGSFRYQELYTALDRLAANERTAVLLFYMENYSVKEISEIQEVSQDAVKQRLSRGRQHLRGLLKD